MSNENRRPNLHVAEPEADLSSVAVVGAGRLGTVLAVAMRAAGVEVTGPLGRDAAPRADVTLLCVPDGEIVRAAEAAAGGARFVGHTSGATTLDALAPASRAGARVFGLHPLQTFPRLDAGHLAAPRLQGAGAAIAGSDRSATTVARRLAVRLGMRPFEIDDGDRAAYHAAASIASNFLVTLQASVEAVAAGAGISQAEARRLFAPLVEASVDSWRELGPDRALTGPIARGDELTVERQRAAVERVAPEHLELYDALAERTRALAFTAGAREPSAAAPTGAGG
jgi:predicted short-subunit dehydrogenase-like oxidoreductase (DUF2520 family)